MEKEYTYYSVDEFTSALSELSQSEYKKLMLFGYRFCQDYSLGCEGEDLFQEAVSRFITGSRKAPKEIKLIATLFNAMKSIGDAYINSKYQQARDASLRFDAEDGIDLEKFKPTSEEPEEVLSEYKYQLILKHFGEDEQILSMIKLIGEGAKAKEITDTFFDGDRKKYDTAYKRFTRKRKQLRMETQCI